MAKPFTIFALSDATGGLANSHAVAAVNQFTNHPCEIVRVPKLTDESRLEDSVLKAKECHGIIIFTFVSATMRRDLLQIAAKHQVVAIDIMGPTLDALANYFHSLPSPEPGLQYKMTQNYFKRTEAVEFTVKHDDGLGLDTINDSDIILLGISRTSKTPLSIYLAYYGYRCANMPIVKDIPLPKQVQVADHQKMIALTIEPRKLATIRSSRLQKLGRPDSESYANLSYIIEEARFAQRLYASMGVPVIDVTGKAIEETASEVINLLRL